MATTSDILWLRIERVNAYGLGVGVHEDLKYYVPGTLVGEEVEVKVVQKHGRGTLCELVRLISTNPERTESGCSLFGLCGGCDLQHASYAAQLQLKQNWISKIFSRFAETKILPIVASPQQWHYRNRITLHHDGHAIGFHKRLSHDVVAVKNCPIASEALNTKLADLSSAYLTGPRAVELREDDLSGSFIQVNTLQNETLLRIVAERVKGKKSQKILELYSGHGNLTFTLANLAREVLAVEGDIQAAKRAEELRIIRKIKNVKFVHEPAFKYSYELAEKYHQFDVIVCDPPREGLRDVVKILPRLCATKIVYVSCEPHALAREAQVLQSKGYVLKTLTPIDMFPQTRHVEVVAEFIKV